MLTISTRSFEIHASSEHAFCADGSLHLELVLWGRLLHQVALKHEACVPALGDCGESKRNLLLSTKKLGEEHDEKNHEVKWYGVTNMNVTRWHFG